MDVTTFISHGARVRRHGIFNYRLRKTFGFTLLELIISVAIFSIISAIGIPSLHHFLAHNRASSQINDLLGTIALTRGEAIKRGRQVTLCQTRNNESCEDSGNWSDGWMLYIDENKNRTLDNSETLLYTGQKLSGNTQISFNGGFGIDGYIIYKPDGSVFPNGTFTVCLKEYPSHARALILYRTGRLRQSKKTANDEPITCS